MEIPGNGRSARRSALGQLAKESERLSQGGRHLTSEGRGSVHEGCRCVFQACTLATERRKRLRRHGWTSGVRYLSVRRRPGYSSSGCTPAEPDSASPGKQVYTVLTQPAERDHEQFEGTTISSRRGRVGAAGRSSGCA